ncbi:MAG: WecB/TagA/CpsF family glycosyltransferase [Parcubacteria group bacterium]|nr:WecB/TagA/CpsF family glycosyltransferase [Parcubacteria group bacterium]
MKSVNIMGVEVSDVSHAEALAQVKNFLEDSNQHYLVTPNPEIVLKASQDHKLRRILNHADLSLPDGFGLKIAARILGQKLSHRVPGADFMLSMLGLAEVEQWPVFLLGGLHEKVSEQAAWHLRYRYKQLKIVGYASGGVVEFKQGRWQTSDAKLLARINQSRAKILLVGFGCPKQEKWIFQNLDKLPAVSLAMTVGGTLDFLAGERKRALYLVRRLGLEWLWRLIIEPSRFKRIWNATAAFIWKSIAWSLRMRFAYRPNVVAAILNQDNKLLLIKRSDTAEEHWQFPQGGVDAGETPESAVLREVKEETGIANHITILGAHPHKHSYRYPSKWHQHCHGYKGQKQTIFYLKYTGPDRAITLEAHEASDYAWVAPERVVKTVFHRRKRMAEIAIESLHHYAENK